MSKPRMVRQGHRVVREDWPIALSAGDVNRHTRICSVLALTPIRRLGGPLLYPLLDFSSAVQYSLFNYYFDHLIYDGCFALVADDSASRGKPHRSGREPTPMQAFALDHEFAIRLGFFAAVFSLTALWEVLAPRRRRAMSRLTRWTSNLGVVLLNTLLLRLLLPMAAVGLAMLGEERDFGLFNIIGLPFWLAAVLSVVAMDFVIYLQHVAFHAIPTLWRLHRVHHADLDFDVTTGIRFHPIEIALSMLVKLGAVLMLGPPAVAVLTFEVLLNATAMFNHANARLPAPLDGMLRWLVVTPDMHRVHHSHRTVEINSNFGFNLPWWDRLLGTYRAQPAEGHEHMTIGLDQFPEPKRNTLPWMLVLPFIGPSGQDSLDPCS